MKKSSNIQLNELNQKLVSDEYINWMNDYEITKLTEQRFLKHTKKSTIKFVNEMKKSKIEYLFGIFYVKKNKTHIGNIKLGPINNYHKFAEISYLIEIQIFKIEGLQLRQLNKY